jgi:hypothetical protein
MSKNKIPLEENIDGSTDYSKLRLDHLKELIAERNIDCKQTKEEIVKHLKLDDEGIFIRPVTYEKINDDKFIIGISLNDTKNFIEIGKFVEKGIAKNMGVFYGSRVHYISKQKLV